MKLSFIICTRNRAHAIIPCLESIAQSLTQAALADAEIVVVDNGSKDDTSAIVKKWAEACAIPVRLVSEPRQGLAIARNSGIRAAQGELLVFTDDDCRLSKNYVTDLLRYDAADTELVLRGGRVELGDPTDLPVTIKLDPDLKRWSRSLRSARRESLGNCIIGCNMAMRRGVIDRIGPFDEHTGAGTKLPGGEDTDYIFRTYVANIPIEYVPDMAVYHHHGRKSNAAGNGVMRNYMIGMGALYTKHFFEDFDLCRPVYWDLKYAVREIISGKNYFMPETGFTYKKVLACYMLGAAKYFAGSVARQVNRSRA